MPGWRSSISPISLTGGDTALIAAARAAGCDIVVDGLDVLLFQGAAAFERWTGLAAPLVAMREALRGS